MDQYRSKRKLGLADKIYQQTLSWCGKRHAKFYLGFLSCIEAIFFPVPPDVMLVPMVLANPKQAWWLAGLTTAASVVGGVIGYVLGYYAFEAIGLELLTALHLEGAYGKAIDWFVTYGFVAIIIAGVTPIPYKVFTLAAGASHMAFFPFILASLVGRAFRFYFVAGCMRYFGQSISLTKKQLVAICLVMMTLMMGCSSTRRVAPVETLSLSPIISGVHDVEAGDTIYSIAWRYDRDYHELAELNHLSSPYRLQVGQQLSLGKNQSNASFSSGYVDSTSGTRSIRPEFVASSESEPSLTFEPVEEEPSAPTKTTIAPKFEAPKIVPIKSKLPAAKGRWMWPLEGKLLARFVKSGSNINKGIDIAGTRGASVYATSSGKVVYAGNGLRGYGNLIIIKHDEEYLSAYAHNEMLLTKEGDNIKQGQVIAKVGGSDSDRPKLHFEIRYRGQPVDPLTYLPSLT
jgi:lipoprotein NlpD